MTQWTVDCSKYLTIEEIINYFTRIVKQVRIFYFLIAN